MDEREAVFVYLCNSARHMRQSGDTSVCVHARRKTVSSNFCSHMLSRSRLDRAGT